MKAPVKILVISLGVIASLVILTFLNNLIKFYTIPTPSNEPTIMQGNHVFSSNLRKPKRFDFICYYFKNESSKAVYVKRLCGLAGDTLEIRNGDLFVNNNSVDHLFSLYHEYLISQKNLEYLNTKGFDKKNILEGPNQQYNDGDTVFTVLLSKVWAADKNINAKRNLLAKNIDSGSLSDVFNKNWNHDNFGPIVIPKGKYFVLGDSRENSMDSRHTGYVDESDFIGVVIKKW